MLEEFSTLSLETLPQKLLQHLLQEGAPDKLIWLYTKHGNYEVRSGYQAEKERRKNHDNSTGSTSNSVDINIWKQIWNAKTTPKIKNFIWKLCKNVVPTRCNLFKRKMADSNTCPVCQEATEDVEHLLLLCPWTRPIWFGSTL